MVVSSTCCWRLRMRHSTGLLFIAVTSQGIVFRLQRAQTNDLLLALHTALRSHPEISSA